MAVKTFVSGEILTASDTNTFLNNAGLVYITQGSLSGTATNFAGCFSSTYNQYVINLESGSLSGNGDLYWQFLSGTTPLTGAGYQWAWSGHATSNTANNGGSVTQTLGFTGISLSGGILGGERFLTGSWTFFGPMNSTQSRQSMFGKAFCFPGDWVMRDIMSFYNGNIAPRDGIRFLTNTAVTMQGVVTIFGVRQP